MSYEKKIYTPEENIKWISFGIKKLGEELQAIRQILEALSLQKPHKKGDENSLPF